MERQQANQTRSQASQATRANSAGWSDGDLHGRTDLALFQMAEHKLQSGLRFTLFFGAYPIVLFVFVPVSVALLFFAPAIGGPLMIITIGVLIAPWIAYRKALRTLHRLLMNARDGPTCGHCGYDLVGIDSIVYPECGTPRAHLDKTQGTPS